MCSDQGIRKKKVCVPKLRDIHMYGQWLQYATTFSCESASSPAGYNHAGVSTLTPMECPVQLVRIATPIASEFH